MPGKQLRQIPASEWVTYPEPYKEALRKFGAVPVNDPFIRMGTEQHKIWVLYGGRGGGKPDATADHLILESRTEKYMKCYYGRKVYETVRHSCFETLVAAIKKMGLESEFTFSEAENSSMIITHRE